MPLNSALYFKEFIPMPHKIPLSEVIPVEFLDSEPNLTALADWAATGHEDMQRHSFGTIYYDRERFAADRSLSNEQLHKGLSVLVRMYLTEDGESDNNMRRVGLLHAHLNGETDAALVEKFNTNKSYFAVARHTLYNKFRKAYPTFELLQGVVEESTSSQPKAEQSKSWGELTAGKTLPCESNPEWFYARGAEQNAAAKVCKTDCPDKVREACGEEALASGIEWGVWGGLTERERRAILRRRSKATA